MSKKLSIWLLGLILLCFGILTFVLKISLRELYLIFSTIFMIVPDLCLFVLPIAMVLLYGWFAYLLFAKKLNKIDKKFIVLLLIVLFAVVDLWLYLYLGTKTTPVRMYFKTAFPQQLFLILSSILFFIIKPTQYLKFVSGYLVYILVLFFLGCLV